MAEETTTPDATVLDAESVGDSFHLIAAGLSRLVDGRPAAVHLVHGHRLVAVAVAGLAEHQRAELLAAPWSVAHVARHLIPAPGEGVLHLWPAARLTPAPPALQLPRPQRGSVGAVGQNARAGLLVASVRDAAGHLRATVMVEVDDADADQLLALDQFAARAVNVALVAIEHQDFAERLRFADATRRIAGVAASGTSLDEVMRETADDIVRLFGLVGLRARVAAPGLPLVQTAYAGPWPPDPEWLDELTDDFAARYWEKQRIAITSTEYVDPSDPPEIERLREYLRETGWSSSALVPLGAGSECFGSLALVRAVGAPPWTGIEAAAALEIGLDLGRIIASARALERERRLVGELQAVDAYKNRLIGTVSHELRNPLTAIGGNLELLADADLDQVARRAVDVAQRWAGRMSRVVDDLLHLARTLDDQAPAGAARVELGGVVYDAVELLADEARHRGAHLTLELPEGPADVVGDLDLLGQVALNLISNAIKYSPSGGPVRVAVRVHEAEAELLVADRGIGISEADQQRLFTEFFRSADPAVHAQPGTGLGLTIVDRLVRRHGGRIDLESELGSGTVVRVRLPLAPPPVQA